jgi:ElaB/YqjD/DUF883 family membrane-anchored ribosome-binding protein
MATDALLSRELKSLHEELSASQRERPSPAADHISVSGDAATQADPLKNAAKEDQLRGTLGKFIEAITEFLEDAEKNVSAHPAAHVIGGMVVGILIGRLVGRR